MTRPIRPVLVAVLAPMLALAAGGCATLATNVEGEFSCRAPKGTCTPTQAIDSAAAAALQNGPAGPSGPQVRLGLGSVVSGGDTARTAERTLRIVFPAHVDAWGMLHDEAVAWAVIENPRWAAELRRKPGEQAAPPLMRQLKRQLEAATNAAEPADDPARESAASAPAGGPVPGPADLDWTRPFILSPPAASPLVLPSTAREAVAGAKAPAVEGFDMPPPLHDRTPRHAGETHGLVYPSAEAIDAARREAAEASEPAASEEGAR